MLINLGQRLENLRTLVGFLKAARAESLDRVLAIADSLNKTEIAAQSRAWMLSNPAVAQLAAENYAPARPALEELNQLPTGTLGQAYASLLLGQNLSPDDLQPAKPATNADEYIVERLRVTHDIAHVITGFGTDPASELGLQAFNLRQNRTPLAVLLIAGGLLKTIKEGRDPAPILRQVARGIELADKAELLVAQRWEEHWDWSLEQWRQSLNLPV